MIGGINTIYPNRAGHRRAVAVKDCSAEQRGLRCKLPLPLRRGAFSSPEQICSRIRDLPGPPGQPTCSDDLQRFLSCRNVGLRSARDGFKSCFDRTLSGKSLAEPYRISIERFTARVPKMPKYMQEIDLI